MHRFMKALAEKVGMTSDEADKLLAEDAEDGSGTDDGVTTTGEGHMSDELKKLQADVEALTKRAEDAEAKATELEELLAKATEPEPEPEPEPEVPEAVQKQLSEMQKRADEAEEKLAKEIDRRETETFIAKARQFDSLPGANPDDFAGILRKIEGALDEAEREKFDEVLKASNAAVKAGKLYEEVGTGGRGATSVEGEVAKLAEEMIKENPEMTPQIARGEIWKKRPDLLAAYEAERKALTQKED